MLQHDIPCTWSLVRTWMSEQKLIMYLEPADCLTKPYCTVNWAIGLQESTWLPMFEFDRTASH